MVMYSSNNSNRGSHNPDSSGAGAFFGVVGVAGVLGGVALLFGLLGVGVLVGLAIAAVSISVAKWVPVPLKIGALTGSFAAGIYLLFGIAAVPVFLLIATVLFAASILMVAPFQWLRAIHVTVRLIGALGALAIAVPLVQGAFARAVYPMSGQAGAMLDCARHGFGSGDHAAGCWRVRDAIFVLPIFVSCDDASCSGRDVDSCSAAGARINRAKAILEQSGDSTRALTELEALLNAMKTDTSCLRQAKAQALIEEGAIYNHARRQPKLAFERYRQALASTDEPKIVSIAYVEMGLIAYISDEQLGDYEMYFSSAKQALQRVAQRDEQVALLGIMTSVYRDAGKIAPV